MRDRATKMKKSDCGFTLVEVLVVLAITGLITAGLVNFMVSQSRSYSLQEDVQEMEQNTRVAMDFLESALQRTQGITPLTNGITLQYDADSDGMIDTPQIRFQKGAKKDFYSDDESITGRITVAGTGIGSGFLAAFITQDLDQDGSPDTPLFQVDNPGNPNVVTVTIIARTRRPDPRYTRNNGYRRIVLTRRVLLRNM